MSKSIRKYFNNSNSSSNNNNNNNMKVYTGIMEHKSNQPY